MRILILVLVLVGSWPATAASISPNAGDWTVIHAGTVLAVPGKEPKRNQSILIRRGKIIEIRGGFVAPSALSENGGGVRVIDLSGYFVLPGLIDVQTHITSQQGMPDRGLREVIYSDADLALTAALFARRTLEAGFTTIRNMGSRGNALFALRDAIAAGKVPGPRIQVAGNILETTFRPLARRYRPEVGAVLGHSGLCDGPDDCRRAVRAQVRRGSDTLKVFTGTGLLPESNQAFTDGELRAIAESAHMLGRTVTASAFPAASINGALKAGFDAVVHGAFADDASIRLMKENDAFFIPTLLAGAVVGDMARDPKTPFSERWRRDNLAIERGIRSSFARAHVAGVKIAFGTDAGWRPHGRNAEQFALMVGAGMKAMEAIVAATITAADLMGLSAEIGTLAPGKAADLIATGASPLDDISELTRVRFVMRGGMVHVQE